MVHVVDLDHVVLNVADVRRSVDWYRDELGLEVVRFDAWERGEVFFPSVRINDATPATADVTLGSARVAGTIVGNDGRSPVSDAWISLEVTTGTGGGW